MALYGRYFHIALLQAVDETSALELRDERHGKILTYSPQNVAAVVSPPMQAKAQTDRLQAWCLDARIDAPLVSHAADLPPALAVLSQRIRRGAELNAQLMRRSAELRSLHEELQNSYDALRSYVAANGLMPPRLGFINPPDPDGVVLPEGVAEVVQPIPVELRSLCGISLHLAGEVPRFCEGRLIVELLAADDDGIRFCWAADCSAIPKDWVTFVFEQNGRFLRKSPVLRLRYETIVGHGPLFSLGAPQLRRDKAATIDGETGSRALAFKAWTSIPGAPLNLSNQMWPIIRIDSRPITQIELTIDGSLSVTDALNVAASVGFDVVVLIDDRKSLLVHPVEHQTTVARIYEACPPGTATVIAEVETENEMAGRIEYALAVLSPDAAQMVGQGIILPDTALASDWLSLPTQTPGVLHLSLERPLTSAVDLYLMTRLPPGQTADFAWAHFKRVSFKGQFS